MRGGVAAVGAEGHGAPAGGRGAGATEGPGADQGKDREAAAASAARHRHHPGKQGNFGFHIFPLLEPQLHPGLKNLTFFVYIIKGIKIQLTRSKVMGLLLMS